MAKDLIRYDLLVQDAFRGLFRRVLTDAAANGLPGDHHFYITFLTHAPGVDLSERLRAQYPERMTIILQHQFWNLKVDDHGFEVGLSFKQIPERLVVPFSAVTAFFDPSVNFGTEFTVEDEEAEEEISPRPAALQPTQTTLTPVSASPPPAPADVPAAKTPEPPAAAPEQPAAAAEPAGDSPKVVSIDAFRKKTP